MKISSYNITDVGYHYVGLRVLANPAKTREDQLRAISRGVLKYSSDRALRLMLPEPKSNFATVGEKVCQELVHFQFSRVEKGVYILTETGREVLGFLNERRFVELRRAMAYAHLAAYENLREVVQRHIEIGCVWRAIIETDHLSGRDYIERLLRPTFNGTAEEIASRLSQGVRLTPKQIEDAVNERIIDSAFPLFSYSVPLFRALADRLVSLRLLNIMKASSDGCEFAKSYTPCVAGNPTRKWYYRLDVPVAPAETYTIFLCEPDMSDDSTLKILIKAIESAFGELRAQAGYYDLPEVRDYVCERLRIPEASFDEGVNSLLDHTPSILSPGLRYEGISGKRKPLVRSRGTTQIHNLIRHN